MNKYLITLTPIDKFFFGGDMTFKVGEDENSDYNRKFSSYIIESNLFPQQTSLLGMLRFFLLRHSCYFDRKSIIPDKKDLVCDLIGEHSFQVNEDGHSENKFGCICSVTSCFIRQELIENGNSVYRDWRFAPFDAEWGFGDSRIRGHLNGKEIEIPELKNFNAKKGYSKGLENGGQFLRLEDVFVPEQRMGINRNIQSGKTDDSALFKQVCYRFSDRYHEMQARYSFAFMADIANIPVGVMEYEDLCMYSGELVNIGADNSQFIMSITKVNEEENCLIEKKEKCIVLQSPTFLEPQDVEIASFGITELLPFRFLRSNVRVTNSYHVLANELTRSKAYYLYAPGSVFYFKTGEERQAFENAISSKKDFCQIGYNQYK